MPVQTPVDPKQVISEVVEVLDVATQTSSFLDGLKNPATTFVDALNLISTVAPKLGAPGAALSLGISQAAIVGGAGSLAEKFSRGALQPSDVLGLT